MISQEEALKMFKEKEPLYTAKLMLEYENVFAFTNPGIGGGAVTIIDKKTGEITPSTPFDERIDGQPISKTNLI